MLNLLMLKMTYKDLPPHYFNGCLTMVNIANTLSY